MGTSDRPSRKAKKEKPVPIRLDIRPMGTSPRIDEFIDLAYSYEGINVLGTSDFSPVLVHVYEQEGFLHLLLDMNDDTTAEDLRRAAPLVVALRDRLLEFQGPRTCQGTKVRLYKDLYYLNRGNTLPALTATLNELIADHLANFYQFVCELQQANCSSSDEFIAWLTEKPRYLWALACAEELLRRLNIPGIRTDAEIHEFCRTTLERIHRGENRYVAVGKPLEEDHLRDRLRNYSRTKVGRSLKKHQQE